MSARFTPLVVGVAGPTRSGKGTLVNKLCAELPVAGKLGQDAYFKKGGETPDCIDWRTLRKNLDKLIANATRDTSAKKKRQVVLIEGFLIFADDQVAASCDVKLFLHIDKDTCYQRRKATKCGGGGARHGSAFNDEFEKKIWPAFEAHGDCSSGAGMVVLDAMQAPEKVAECALGVIRDALKTGSAVASSTSGSALAAPEDVASPKVCDPAEVDMSPSPKSHNAVAAEVCTRHAILSQLEALDLDGDGKCLRSELLEILHALLPELPAERFLEELTKDEQVDVEYAQFVDHLFGSEVLR